MVAEGWSTTTTRTSRIAGSIVNRNNFHSASFSHSADFHGGNFAARAACVPAPSAGSIMAGLRERAPSEGAPALVASTEAAMAGGFHGGGGGFHGGGGGRR